MNQYQITHPQIVVDQKGIVTVSPIVQKAIDCLWIFPITRYPGYPTHEEVAAQGVEKLAQIILDSERQERSLVVPLSQDFHNRDLGVLLLGGQGTSQD